MLKMKIPPGHQIKILKNVFALKQELSISVPKNKLKPLARAITEHSKTRSMKETSTAIEEIKKEKSPESKEKP